MDSPPAKPRIFISYRRSDSQAAARQLADALRRRFGEEYVFFDTQSLRLGMSWEDEIVERVQAADVVLAVIGKQWLATADERGRWQRLDPAAEDVLRVELETAMRGRPHVVPVLVDDAQMPPRDRLPRPFRPITRMQARAISHHDWDRDVEVLIDELARMELPRDAAEPTPHAPSRFTRAPTPPEALDGVDGLDRLDGIDPEHFATVARHFVEGRVVPVIGPGANVGEGNEQWKEGCGWLPDAAELASHLSRRFALDPELDDLARVTQQIFLTEGDVDLYRALREVLIKTESRPGPVHRFLARTPSILRALGRDRHPMIVTTSYDTALEHAFDQANEPFDLVVFMAGGDYKGQFLHIPWWDGEGGGPRPIAVPNSYVDLPIDEELDLERTVIVKIHGGPVHDAPPAFRLRDNFVVTEDNYIGYLSRSPIEGHIPVQILDKLRESRHLFLGFGLRHWTLRVFLLRLWSEKHVGSKSWAVQRTLPRVEREFWERFDVDRLVAPLPGYVAQLEGRLTEPARAQVE